MNVVRLFEVHLLCFFELICHFLLVINAKSLRFQPVLNPIDDYIGERNLLLSLEKQMSVGGGLSLSPKEELLNKLLMVKKTAEVNQSFVEGKPYPPSLHFFKAKPLIDKSDVFKMIKLMPKGGALHLHDVSILQVDWLVKNATYRENCYMCYKPDSRIQFIFSYKTPQDADCSWSLVKDERESSKNPAVFDQWLYNNLSLIVDDPMTAYPSENEVWEKFEASLTCASGLIWHTPVFKDYLYQSLLQFNEDNVQYLEIRTLMTQTYELDGSKNPQIFTLETYRNVCHQFVADHNGKVSGCKIIYTDLRHKTEKEISGSLKMATGWWKNFPDFMVGFDLVGQEDMGHSLFYFIKELLRENPTGNKLMPYFFHAGETNWQGTSVDENLIDAVFLNTTRIGHGYALLKHPLVLSAVKAREIAIEVNPISNQVLKLLADIRNHPAAVFIAENYPVVISSDDGAAWGAEGLSYDFYQAFMGLASEHSDLRLLKQLAINSIKYSAMSTVEKSTAMKLWTSKWEHFLEDAMKLFD